MKYCLVIVLMGLLVEGSSYYSRNLGNVASDNSDAISFPGETQRPMTNPISKNLRNSTTQNKQNNMIPPLEFIQKISNYTVSDLLLNYVDDYEDDALLANRFGGDVERSPAITPKPAPCIPELQTIRLVPEEHDPSVIYIPSCTRVEKCGGCCSHNLLSCQPKETELVSYKVLKTQFAAGNRLKYVGKEIIHVEKHTKCHCGCRIQPSDCTAVQKYNAAECKCTCANTDEEQKCHAGSGKKLWDYTTCSCQCRNTTHCSTGFMFDQINCKCIPIPKRRHVIEQKPVNEEDKQKPEPFTFQLGIDEYDY